MKKNPVKLIILAAGVILSILTGCTQMPTEKQGIVDLRPQLSFRTLDDGLREGRVLVDGLDMGKVGDYAEGVTSLRVVSGSHVVRVEVNGRTILEERVYTGDGVNRTILVK
jgi:hypothetical protein